MALYRELVILAGKTAVLRNPEPEDAQRMIELVRAVDEQSIFLSREPGEFSISVEEERRIIEERKNSPLILWIAAELDGRLVGLCEATIAPRLRYRHKATFAICVCKPYWGMGIGRAMLERCITWCRDQGLKKAELVVDTGNDRALALYRSLGFREEGRIKMHRRLADGSYRDSYMMGLMLLGEEEDG